MSDIIGDALLEAFAKRGYEAGLPEPTTLSIVLPDGATATTDISGWRQYAGRNSRADLPRLAADFADQAVTAFARDNAALARDKPEPARDKSESTPDKPEIERLLDEGSLRLRLYPEDQLDDEMRQALVTRPLAPGLLETVVVDYPDAMMPLNRSKLGGVTEDAVFGAAIRASLEKEPHYTRNDEIFGVPIMTVGETHRYVGAHLHLLHRHAGPAPFGALVAVPIPEYVIVHVIGKDNHLFAGMEAMQALARTHVENGEKPITSQVFWWRPGQYERLPEPDAFASGLVPELRPVAIEVDHDDKSVAALTADTGELIDLWMNA
ncbi:hypothetical protein [Actinomadura rudentiformis]|uniref:Uncharacterized protein n=1 Tax=Actinomadura rudentiformis TaxID=359158 RepID=A0A6H9YLP3_9ACTN|nr:hypothetical protein [Actinomadura rudentiformis]KAB2339341.1 hypothetical protein F8566_48460 [Actinomadura rudentiformis]